MKCRKFGIKIVFNVNEISKILKIRYWINYRLPGGKQRREFVGYSIEEARDADGKRRSQKRENKIEEIFDIQAEAKMTFTELGEWWLGLTSVQHALILGGSSLV